MSEIPELTLRDVLQQIDPTQGLCQLLMEFGTIGDNLLLLMR